MENSQTPENKGVPAPTKTKSFTTRGFTKIEGMEHLVEEFKNYYLSERKSGRTDLMQIFRDFRRSLQYDRKVWFNPYPNLIKSYFAKWEKSLPFNIRTIPIKGRDVKEKQDDEKKIIKDIAYHDLENGAKNLQQMLVDDAEQLIKESNQDYQLIDDAGGLWDKASYEKIRVKKKELALAIADKVLGGVHKNELVKIKKNKEGRETAGFLMDLVSKSTAGELTDDQLDLLEQGLGIQ